MRQCFGNNCAQRQPSPNSAQHHPSRLETVDKSAQRHPIHITQPEADCLQLQPKPTPICANSTASGTFDHINPTTFLTPFQNHSKMCSTTYNSRPALKRAKELPIAAALPHAARQTATTCANSSSSSQIRICVYVRTQPCQPYYGRVQARLSHCANPNSSYPVPQKWPCCCCCCNAQSHPALIDIHMLMFIHHNVLPTNATANNYFSCFVSQPTPYNLFNNNCPQYRKQPDAHTQSQRPWQLAKVAPLHAAPVAGAYACVALQLPPCIAA